MAVTTYKAAASGINDTSIGTLNWSSDDIGTALVGTEISSDDDIYAGFQGVSSSVSCYLKCTDFGFTDSDIPLGSTIDGVEFEVVQKRYSVPLTASTLIKFVKSGTISGSDFGVVSDWSTTETSVVYGSPTELGGLILTQSDITSSDFGCAISVTMASSRIGVFERSHLVDQVRMRIYYSTSVIGLSNIVGVASMTGVSSIIM